MSKSTNTSKSSIISSSAKSVLSDGCVGAASFGKDVIINMGGKKGRMVRILFMVRDVGLLD